MKFRTRISLSLSILTLKEEQAQLVKTEALSHKTEKPQDKAQSEQQNENDVKEKSITNAMLFSFCDPNERYFELFGGGFKEVVVSMS